MPNITKACSLYQGFNFKKDQQHTVGFIVSMKIGDTTLTADIAVKDPLNPTTDLKVVAVLNDASWDVGPTDAIYYSGQISTANRQNVAMLVMSDLTKIEVLFKFAVYEYDPLQKKYFKCFDKDDAELKGLVEKSGNNLSLAVAEAASAEVQSPENYSMQVGIKPQPTAQTIHIATGEGKNVVKAWGIAVS